MCVVVEFDELELLFFIFLIWVGMSLRNFLILKKKKKDVRYISLFHPTLYDKNYFDTKLKGWELIWHSWKVRDQFDTRAKGWRPNM